MEIIDDSIFVNYTDECLPFYPILLEMGGYAAEATNENTGTPSLHVFADIVNNMSQDYTMVHFRQYDHPANGPAIEYTIRIGSQEGWEAYKALTEDGPLEYYSPEQAVIVK